MKTSLTMLVMLLLVASFAWSGAQQEEAASATGPVEFMRFFGEAPDQYADITDLNDPSNFAGESTIIQIMTNAYNEQNPGDPVETTVVDWPGFTELNTRIAAGDPPDIMILHGIRIPNYASRGLLTRLDEHFERYNINPFDFSDAAREYVTYEDGLYGVPLDLHGHLYYINLDLWEQADMVDLSGRPMIPTNWADWQNAARRFYDATGKTLFTWPVDGLSRDWMAFVYQQGGSIVDSDGAPAINTPEGIAALDLITEFYDGVFSEEGVPGSSMIEMFANEETGSMKNGTWHVNNIDAQAADPEIPLDRFYVTSLPQFFSQPATWSSTHAFIVPLGVNPDPARLDGAMKFLSFMNEHNDVWAYTGHFPVNESFYETEEYLSLPHRREYNNFVDEAIAMPRYDWVTAYENVLNEEVQAAVLGDKTVEQALADAQARLSDFAQFGQ